jgi:hypothetical protein
VNSQAKSIKSQNICIFIGFVCGFIDFLCEFTVKTTEHTVVSYESSDFTLKFLTVQYPQSPILLAILSSALVWPNSGNRLEMEWRLTMPPVVPAYWPVNFPPVPRETESTWNSPQLRSGTGSSTIVYNHTPEGELDVQ